MSILSLEDVTFYPLTRQNDKKVLTNTEMLVELIGELGVMEKRELSSHMK